MAARGLLERFKQWRESLPGNGYSAITELPPGSRPPRESGLPIQPALRAIEYLQAEREKAVRQRALAEETLTRVETERLAAISERDKARDVARYFEMLLRSHGIRPQSITPEDAPWLLEEDG